MPDPYAPREQIRRFTCRVYGPAQCRALKRRGIPYTTDAEGKPLVLLRNLPGHDSRDRAEHGRPRLDRI